VIIVAGAIGNFGSVKMEMAFERRRVAMLTKELLDMATILDMDANGE
jgi:hypothetical protein